MKNEKHTKVCFLFKERLDVQRLIFLVDFFAQMSYNIIIKERGDIMDIEVQMKKGKREKEFFYLGFYIDRENNFLLKYGTTCELPRRRREHRKGNPKLKNYPASEEFPFEYVWHIPLSKANTLKLEDDFREQAKELGFYKHIQNDRIVLEKELPEFIKIKIKKEYIIPYRQLVMDFLQ